MPARLVETDTNQTIADLAAGDPLVLGRDPACDVVFAHSRVSRQHVRFSEDHGAFTIEDLGSSNGTSVNGKILQGSQILADGDLIEVAGSVRLIFEEEVGAGGWPRLLIPSAAVIALALGAFLLWPRGDGVMEEAQRLASDGLVAHERGDPAGAKQKLNQAVEILFDRGRLDDVPRTRVREEGLRRLGAGLGGAVDLLAVYRSALEGARPTREALRVPAGGPCRLDSISVRNLDLCLRESAERVLFNLWQDPDKIPETFYVAVRDQLWLLVERRRGWLEASLERGRPYARMMETTLEEANMPRVLRYLALIESGYEPRIRSKAGARGMWQFMPATARGYGLRVDAEVDERTDPEKATRAAAHYLRDLAFEFGGDALLLAIASYNKGENGIRRALKKLDDPRTERSYWTLVQRDLLPQETRDYVPRLIAAAALGEGGLPSRDVVSRARP